MATFTTAPPVAGCMKSALVPRRAPIGARCTPMSSKLCANCLPRVDALGSNGTDRTATLWFGRSEKSSGLETFKLRAKPLRGQPFF